MDSAPVWITAREAQDRACTALKSGNGVRDEIMTRARKGLLAARAELVTATRYGKPKEEHWRVLDAAFWDALPTRGEDYYLNWPTGRLAFTDNRTSTPIKYDVLNVQFDAVGLAAWLGPDPQAAPVASPPAKHAGGRPLKAYWEPLLIEMLRQHHAGDLKPTRQVEVEKAMLAWLEANDHDPGVTQVRLRAKQVFDAIK